METMKTVNNLRAYLVLIALALFITSCEQSELNEETSISEDEQIEGFKGQTHSSDFQMEELSDEKALFHMTYSGNISEEEANYKFDVDVKSFMEEYKKSNRGVSTEWFYYVWTHTGTQSNNNTDDDVYSRVEFRTDKGRIRANRTLNHWGDDREKGDWDYYLFNTSYPGQAVSWVELDYARLSLWGTDGWFVTHFNVQAHPAYQSISSSGYTQIATQPNVWLDNATNSTDDIYESTSSVGRLNF